MAGPGDEPLALHRRAVVPRAEGVAIAGRRDWAQLRALRPEQGGARGAVGPTLT